MTVYSRGTPYAGYHHDDSQDDIVSGLYKWLYEKEDLVNLLGQNPGALPRDPLMYEHTIEAALVGEQTNILVLKYAGGWASPSPSHSTKSVRVELEFWCDPLRDEDSMEIDEKEVAQRIYYLYEQFDKVMHRTARLPGSVSMVEYWGTVRTLDCTRLGEFNYYLVPGRDGLLRGSVYYGVLVG